jgi:hypothetical protein
MTLTVPSYYDINNPVVSQSSFEEYMLCCYRFLYNLNLYTDPTMIKKTTPGTFGHAILEHIYKKEKIKQTIGQFIDKYKFPKEIKMDEQEYIRTVMSVLIPNYFKVYPGDLKWDITPEIQFNVMLGTARLVGKMDGIVRDKGNWLLETKFKGNINEDAVVSKLRIDWQSLFYLNAYAIMTGIFLDGVIYNIVRYPQRSAAKGLEVFAEALEEDIKSRPDYFYYRYKTEFTKKEILEFREELCEKLNDLSNRKVFWKNQCACNAPFPCAYIEACSSGDFSGLKKKRKLFEELDYEHKGKVIAGKQNRSTPLVRRK